MDAVIVNLPIEMYETMHIFLYVFDYIVKIRAAAYILH